MSCEQIRPLLYDHAGGELTASCGSRVRGHLEDCPACRRELAAAAELRRAVARLPREVTPQGDLWPAIARRLDEVPQGSRLPAGRWRVAAALILVAGGLLAAALLQPGPGRRQPAIVLPVATLEPASAAAGLRQEDGVLHAYRDLVMAVERRRGRLDAEGSAALAAGLAELERAVVEIQQALGREPDDRRLRLALAEAYRREAHWAARLSDI